VTVHAQRRYTLTASCPDRVGIVARVAGFIAENRGWILETSHHADDDAQRYFMRIEIKADSLPFDLAEFRRRFEPIAAEFAMDWRIADSAEKKRLVVLVSQQEHCLYDLLARWQSKELDVEIPCVISNHETFRGFVEWHGIPFHHVPVTTDNRHEANAEMTRLFEAARDHQYPPFLPAVLRRRQALPPGLPPRRQADRRHLPFRHGGTRRRPDHRARHRAHRPRRHCRGPGALRQGHREGGAGARSEIPRRGPRAAQRQPHGGVSLIKPAGLMPAGMPALPARRDLPVALLAAAPANLDALPVRTRGRAAPPALLSQFLAYLPLADGRLRLVGLAIVGGLGRLGRRTLFRRGGRGQQGGVQQQKGACGEKNGCEFHGYLLHIRVAWKGSGRRTTLHDKPPVLQARGGLVSHAQPELRYHNSMGTAARPAEKKRAPWGARFGFACLRNQ